MEEKKQNEEIQSRRDFFKKAAKKALPVIGAITLASSPIIANAAENYPMGCAYCKDTCLASCVGSCYGYCKGTCKYECTGTCKNTCRTTCSGTCHTSCSNSSKSW